MPLGGYRGAEAATEANFPVHDKYNLNSHKYECINNLPTRH